jgi:hypothetical protein
MTDEELLKYQLRNPPVMSMALSRNHLYTMMVERMNKAADRIEQLVAINEQLNAKLAKAEDEIKEWHEEAISWIERWGVAIKGQRESDEKLAKAIGVAQNLMVLEDDDTPQTLTGYSRGAYFASKFILKKLLGEKDDQ